MCPIFMASKGCAPKVFRISSTKKHYKQPPRASPLDIIDELNQPQMGQEQINILPTALCWDSNGELPSEILRRLIDRLQAQEVNPQNQKQLIRGGAD
jgi:hypothetical protein